MDKKNFCLYSGKKGTKNLSQRWFIYWYELDVLTCKNKRIKKYIKDLPTIEARHKEAERVIGELSGAKVPWVGKYSALINSLREVLEERVPYIVKSTYSNYKGQIDNYERYVREKDTYDIQGFITSLSKKKKSPTTINRHIEMLKDFFKVLVKRKIISENPCEDIRKLKERREHGKFFTTDQREALKEEIYKSYPELILPLKFMYYCFLRPRKEMRLIRVSDLNIEQGFIRVRSAMAKDAEERLVIIPDIFLDEIKKLGLDKYPPNHYLVGVKGLPSIKMVHSASFYKKFRKVLKTLKFEDGYTLYSWKNTGNYSAISNNIPLKELQLQNGHAKLSTTEIYTQTMTPYHSDFIRRSFPAF